MEQLILTVAHPFADACQRLEEAKAGSTLDLTLRVQTPSRYDSDKTPRVTLSASFWDGTSHQAVAAADLDSLLNEVYRRAGFADREAIKMDRLQAQFTALPSPKATVDNDITGAL